MYFFKRLKFHTLRFKSVILFGTVLLLLLIMIVAFSFGDDPAFIATYSRLLDEIGLQALFSTLDTNAPAWLFWISFGVSLYLYYVVVICAIIIGSKIVPMEDKENLELLFASAPKNPRLLYLENYISGILALTLILIPNLILLLIFSFTKSATDIFGRLSLSFLFVLLVGIFFLTITSFFSSIRFNKSTGLKFGYLYLIFAFLIEISSNALANFFKNSGNAFQPTTSQILNLSVNRYLDPTKGLLTREFNWNGFLIICLIIFVLVALSIWKIKQVEYIENIKEVKKGRVSIIPQFSPKSRLAKKYPIIFDQFRKDRAFFLIWALIVLFIILYEIFVYIQIYRGTGNLSEVFTSFDFPLVRALVQNHPLQATYTGFMIIEFYALSWMYYGIFIAIIAMNIPNRDYSNGETDIIYGNNITQEKIIIHRIIAMIIQTTLLIWLSYLISILLELINNIEINHTIQFFTFFLMWIYYIGIGLFFVAIGMLPKMEYSKRIVLWSLIPFIIIYIAAYLNSNYEWIKYLSVFYYFDAAGLMLEIKSIGEGTLPVVIFLIFVILFFTLSLKFRFRKMDML